jgi:hypothetical protein
VEAGSGAVVEAGGERECALEVAVQWQRHARRAR